MKATGIVRRIDELGRIVIPKEIRRTLRIREGDPLEIFTDRDGGIVLKKYSPVKELSSFALEYAQALNTVFGHTAAICDNDFMIAAAGTGKRELNDKPLSAELQSAIQSRLRVQRRSHSGTAIRLLSDNAAAAFHAVTMVPIVADGDTVGGVLLLSVDPAVEMGLAEMKTCETAASFLGRQLEG